MGNFPKKGIDNLNEENKIKNEFETNMNEVKVIEDYFENGQEDNNGKSFIKKNTSKEEDIYNEMYAEDDLNNSISKLNGIKINTTINDVVYSLPTLSQNLIKIHSIYPIIYTV